MAEFELSGSDSDLSVEFGNDQIPIGESTLLQSQERDCIKGVCEMEDKTENKCHQYVPHPPRRASTGYRQLNFREKNKSLIHPRHRHIRQYKSDKIFSSQDAAQVYTSGGMGDNETKSKVLEMHEWDRTPPRNEITAYEQKQESRFLPEEKTGQERQKSA